MPVIGPPDWGTEWASSLLWVLAAFALTVLGCALVAWLLTRSTDWGRQFGRLTYRYFSPGPDWTSWRPLVTVLLLLLLTVVAVRIDILLSYSTNGLYTALQRLDPGGFAFFLGIFGVLAAIHVVRSMLTYFVGQMFVIHWRVWLNDRMLSEWLRDQAYHRGRFVRSPLENPDQRIQEDVTSFAENSQTLAFGAVNAVVSLVSFTAILWGLSGPMTVMGIEIPRAMTFLGYIYVIVASVIAFRIGRPLIRLDFLNEALNASYRYALVHLRDHAESVAFYRGEEVERSILCGRFSSVIKNYWAIVFRSMKFQGFNFGVSQLAVVFPVIIQAPRFFSRAITLGDLQQTATAFAQVHDSLSFFRNAYGDFASYRATLNRLTGLLEANAEARALPRLHVEERPQGLQIVDLTVRRPDGQALIAGLSLGLAAGERLLVTGASGSGKTCLLRSLANLWPYASGSVSRPPDAHTLFLPQLLYVPLGSLRAALAYPGRADLIDEARAREVLRQVQLGHLDAHIDEDRHWAGILSPGELQRLGFARLLLGRPRVAFLDESSSALDEGMEHALYSAVHEQLPDCVLVSAGHRRALAGLHTTCLELVGDGSWNVSLPV
jgi:putative ATP-binding cassette transporter